MTMWAIHRAKVMTQALGEEVFQLKADCRNDIGGCASAETMNQNAAIVGFPD
jgi:hypothetical protein